MAGQVNGDEILVALDRGEARGLVEHLEQTFQQCEKPMRLLDIARAIEALLDEPRPYPSLDGPRDPVVVLVPNARMRTLVRNHLYPVHPEWEIISTYNRWALRGLRPSRILLYPDGSWFDQEILNDAGRILGGRHKLEQLRLGND